MLNTPNHDLVGDSHLGCTLHPWSSSASTTRQRRTVLRAAASCMDATGTSLAVVQGEQGTGVVSRENRGKSTGSQWNPGNSGHVGS